MKSLREFKLFLLGIGLFQMCLFTEAHSRRFRPMGLNEALSTELNGVLKAANALHTAFFEQDEDKIEESVDEILMSLHKADSKTALANDQKPHLKKMIRATRAQINVLKNTQGEKRKDSLKNAMEQIVLIAQTYKLDRYKIFFCPKDRAVWLQKSWKAKNPVHPVRYKNCGKLVR